MILKIKLLLILFLAGISETYAQIEKIDTDRPDQTESPVTTPHKWVQLELGFNLQQSNATEKEFLVPTLLSKYGLSKKIELRLITSLIGYQVVKVYTGKSYKTGLEPVELGTKISLTEEKKFLPKTSLLLHVGFPTLASKELRADHLAPRFRFSMQHTLSKIVGLGYNLGAEWDGYSNIPTWVYTLSSGFNLSEKWYGFIEVFGGVTKEDAAQHNIDGGFGFFVNNNIKLDISSGFGISKDAPDWFLGIGASVRFKTRR